MISVKSYYLLLWNTVQEPIVSVGGRVGWLSTIRPKLWLVYSEDLLIITSTTDVSSLTNITDEMTYQYGVYTEM